MTVSSVQRYPSGTLQSRLSSFSNRGLGVIDVAAPGSSILSTLPRTSAASGYAVLGGTSMASPHVGAETDNSSFGEGMVNALHALS